MPWVWSVWNNAADLLTQTFFKCGSSKATTHCTVFILCCSFSWAAVQCLHPIMMLFVQMLSVVVQHRFLGELHLLQLQLLRRNCLCWAFLTRFKIWSSIWMDKLSPWNFRLFTLSTTFLSIERRRWAELPVLLKSMINTLVLLVLSTRLLFPISQVHLRAVCHCQSPGPYSRRQV